MTTASASTSIPAFPRGRLIAYWAATGLVAGPSLMAGPVFSLGFLAASWALRPPSRRLAGTPPAAELSAA